MADDNPNFDKLVDAAEWFLRYHYCNSENATVTVRFRRDDDGERVILVDYEDHDQGYKG